ncbi:hypothetical protein MG293_000855 [Ovis ammon polii]|uniref:Uncharacterized protein n=1 Tax=Ovis ammon polii TaxID=230172 RepID=A0AAD4UR15_OVIAM|nr:hypothetical protein MG293_000855 [Ovis ammon polii]
MTKILLKISAKCKGKQEHKEKTHNSMQYNSCKMSICDNSLLFSMKREHHCLNMGKVPFSTVEVNDSIFKFISGEKKHVVGSKDKVEDKIHGSIDGDSSMLSYEMDFTEVSKGSESSLVLLKYAAAAKSLQSCPTLCDPIDGSPPGSRVSGILQERTPEASSSPPSGFKEMSVGKTDAYSSSMDIHTPRYCKIIHTLTFSYGIYDSVKMFAEKVTVLFQ